MITYAVYILVILMVGIAIFRKPLWGLFLAAIAELWFANYYIFGEYFLRLRLLLLPYILFVIFIWYTVSGLRMKINKVCRNFLMIQAAMVLVVFMVNLAHSMPIELAAVQVARAGVSIVITLLIYFLIDDAQKMRHYIVVLSIALLFSAILGILQIQFGETFYAFKHLFVHNPDLRAVDIRGEASGMALYSLPLAYQIVCVLPILICLTLYNAMKKLQRSYFIASSLIIAVTLFLTTVRSAILGVGAWLVGAVVFQKSDSKAILKRKVALMSVSLLLLVMVYVFVPIANLFTLRDRSAQARLPLNVVGIRIALENPLGIASPSEFNEFSADNYEVVSHMEGAEAVRYLSPHNQFLNTLLYWGIPGFLMLMLLFFYKFRVLFRLLRCKDNYVWAVAFGILGVSVAYVVTSFFHNAGPFTGDIFYWYIVGLIPALVRISSKQSKTISHEETAD